MTADLSDSIVDCCGVKAKFRLGKSLPVITNKTYYPAQI
jgi:hypothetical protein